MSSSVGFIKKKNYAKDNGDPQYPGIEVFVDTPNSVFNIITQVVQADNDGDNPKEIPRFTVYAYRNRMDEECAETLLFDARKPNDVKE